jgi:aminoglycoside N3'-acetyltransferase
LVPGSLTLVHSSYRAVGPVEGGPAAVVRALLDAAGPTGTLLAPTFTTDLTDPYCWPVPPSAVERERRLATMPCFDPATSVPHKMGVIARTLWQTPGSLRSDHPVTSWTAHGPCAAELMRDQPRDDPEGRDGPVGRAWQRDAAVLLLGVDHDANTTIHLAECLLDMPHLRVLPDRYPTVSSAGQRQWRPVLKTTKCSDGFVKLGPELARAGVVRHGRVGAAACHHVRSRDVVRVAVALLRSEPTALLCDDPECVHCPSSRAALAGWKPPEGPIEPV